MIVIRDQTGAQSLIGYEIRIADGRVSAHLEVRDIHINRTGRLHGGIVATLLDAASGYQASLAADGVTLTDVVTVSTAVNYLSGAGLGPVKATASVRGGGRRLLFVDATLADEGGRVIATSTGTFRRVTPDA